MNNINDSELTLTQSNENNVNNVNNNNNDITVEKITTTLVSLVWNKSKEGTPIICAITKNGNIHTKNTVRSYLTALTGKSGAVNYVKSKLDKGEIEILSGSIISWERTTYKSGVPHERNGQTVILDQEDVVDHIFNVDLSPISDLLLNKYLEEYTGTLLPMQEKLLPSLFGVVL